jgi:hypothetical protein
MRVMLLHKLAEDIPEDYVAAETDRGRREDGEQRPRCGALAPPGLDAKREPQNKSPEISLRALPLPGLEPGLS